MPYTRRFDTAKEMIRKKWQVVTFVFFIASVIAITSDFKNGGLFDNVKKLFKSPIKGYKKFDDQDKAASNSVALAEQKSQFQFEKPIQLEGSLVPVGEHLDKSLPSFFHGRKDVENYYFDCSCTPDGGITDCITSCSSVSTLCGQRCTNSRIFSAVEIFVDPDMLTVTSLLTKNWDCEKLVVICSASEAVGSASAAVSSVLASAVVFGAVAAVALGVGIGVPAIVGAHEPVQYHEEYEYTEQYVNQEIGTVLEETHFLDNGCGSNFVQLKANRNFTSSINNFAQSNDGACALLLHKGPCVSPFQWVTLDVQTLQERAERSPSHRYNFSIK